jgi:hypothetical protein
MKSRLRVLRERLQAFGESLLGRRLRKVGRGLFLAGLVGYLVIRFSEIGWGDILSSLPTDWRFYLIFVLLYFMLPIIESVIYRLSWGTPVGRNLPVFIKKRVYNKDFLGYSGEAYLFAWARRHVGLPARRILGIIKDNVVLSGLGSTVFAVVLLAAFLAIGNLEALGISRGRGVLYLVAALAVLGVVVGVGARFRQQLFTLPGRLLVLVFVLHFGRLAVMNVLQVVQWDLVVPGVGWKSWFIFLAAQVIISRIPVLPARDLLFLSASVELAALIGIPRAEMAAMLVVLSALDKLLNLILFLTITSLDSRRPDPALGEPVQEVSAGEAGIA